MTDALAASLMENPAVVGLLVALPSSALGYLGYRRSQHNDAVAEKAGIASSQSASIGQVIAAQDAHIDNLQEDNLGLRGQLADSLQDNRALRDHIKDLNKQLDHIISECRELKRQVALLSQSGRPATEGGA